MELDWRLMQLRTHHTGKDVPVLVTPAVIDTAFSRNTESPFLSLAGAVDTALQSYWRLLNSAATKLSPDEWSLVQRKCDILSDHLAAGSPDALVRSFRQQFPADQEWHTDVEAVRALVAGPIAALSRTEYLAVVDIIGMLRNAGSDDPLFSLSGIVPSLRGTAPDAGELTGSAPSADLR